MNATELAKRDDHEGSLDPLVIERLLLKGDMSGLTPAQKVSYYHYICRRAGLDPAGLPFRILRLNGREILYAGKEATDQLAYIHKLDVRVNHQETIDGIRVVTARVEFPDHRANEDIGAVSVKGLIGEALSNAYMKAVTKAKRRAILSACGLGMLDESEVDSIPGAEKVAAVEAQVVKQGNDPASLGELRERLLAKWSKLSPPENDQAVLDREEQIVFAMIARAIEAGKLQASAATGVFEVDLETLESLFARDPKFVIREAAKFIRDVERQHEELNRNGVPING